MTHSQMARVPAVRPTVSCQHVAVRDRTTPGVRLRRRKMTASKLEDAQRALTDQSELRSTCKTTRKADLAFDTPPSTGSILRRAICARLQDEVSHESEPSATPRAGSLTPDGSCLLASQPAPQPSCAISRRTYDAPAFERRSTCPCEQILDQVDRV